jgi:two-component system, OmpR family, response regulator RegX3
MQKNLSVGDTMKIVFLEDHLEFANEIVALLKSEGHEVHHYSSGRECLKALNNDQFDIALLDWEVPDMSGTEVLAHLKIKGLYPPVIFLTGRDSEEDVLAVIASGADDYIVKPPNTKILMARINALYRRANPRSVDTNEMNYGHLHIDFIKRKFEIAGQPVKLTEKECDLAIYFFSQIGVLLSRTHLTKVVWLTSADIDTRTIDVHVSHLRSKLKLLPQFGWRLISVYHQGYRLERLE